MKNSDEKKHSDTHTLIPPFVGKGAVISIVMPAYNVEMYIREAIESIINQSFTNFECIIVDDGSTDSTRDIVRSYNDKRIVMIENEHNYIGSLNMGLHAAGGKYIARMDADDMMHPDRLKIQYATMETEPTLTICSTWMRQFGENVPVGSMACSLSGLVELPLLAFLRTNFVFHPTSMIRKSFLTEHKLQYEDYPYAEDLKLWTEIAKHGGLFYVDNQPLLYYRISESQVTQQKREDQNATAEQILLEVMNYLIDKNRMNYPELTEFLSSFRKLQENGLINFKSILEILQKIFLKNKNKLQLA